MNIRAAIIHIIGDIIQSIGVVIAAIIIFVHPDWEIADPICTFLFTFLCFFTTVPIFRDCCAILMESTPKSIDVAECFNDLIQIGLVEEIHDFHVWSLSSGKNAMSCHARSPEPYEAMRMMNKILKEEYNIFHTTIQMEKSNSINGSPQKACCDND